MWLVTDNSYLLQIFSEGANMENYCTMTTEQLQNDDEWINAEEFKDASGNVVAKVAFSVTVEETNTGIQKIEYSAYGDEEKHYQTAVYSEKDGIYTFVTNEEYADGVDYQWFVRVTNNVQTSAVTEIAGGKIDTTAPSKKAYIKFLSDTEGANNTDLGTVTDGKWTSNIYEMASDAWNKIWGREKITYEVYVQDVTSGVESIVMSYNGKSVDSLTLVEGLKAFEPGNAEATNTDSNAVGYTVFTGTITTNEKVLNIKNFQIDSITDVAGNTVNGPIVLDNALDTTKLCSATKFCRFCWEPDASIKISTTKSSFCFFVSLSNT